MDQVLNVWKGASSELDYRLRWSSSTLEAWERIGRMVFGGK